MSDNCRRLALVADVHGNLPALQAVLADARDKGAVAVWNAGDCVGYGAQPAECVALLREACEFSVLGNYDEKVLAFLRRRTKWTRTKHPLKFRAFEYAWENLDPVSREWLATRPRQVFSERNRCRILLVHTSDLADDDPVGEVDLVLGGHIHRPLDRPGRPRFVFAGSVGRPEDGDPRAHYTLLEISGQDIKVENRRVTYDVARAVEALNQKGQPEAFGVMMRRGVDLTAALKIMEDEPAG